MAIFTDGMYALLVSSAGQWLKFQKKMGMVERYVAGLIYIGLCIGAALASSPQ